MIYVKGDLLKTDMYYIAHGCNCLGGFGAGVAGAIAKQYPEVKKVYQENTQLMANENSDMLGTVIEADTNDGKHLIFNCYTQRNVGPGDQKHVSYAAVVSCFNEIHEHFPDAKDIAIPLIGCGLAGGDWNVMEEILQDVEDLYGIDFVVYILDDMTLTLARK